MNEFRKEFTGSQNDDIYQLFDPIEIPTNGDMNNYTKPGRYVSKSTANTETLSNIPPGLDIGFTMDVIPCSATVFMQVIYPYNLSGLIIRVYLSNHFTEYFRIPCQSYAYKQKGSTSERPTLNTSPTQNQGKDLFNIGYYYYDTTLGKPIWWNGDGWVDATGATV